MRPIAEMLRKASIRTRDRDSTHSRIPSNVPAPVEPPSTHVVTPVERAMSSVRGPKSDEPMKQCAWRDRKSTRLNSSHGYISYAVFCLKKKKNRPANERHPSSSAEHT